MAIQHHEPQERISLEEFFALVESDPEHRYELIDGYPSMMTGESPDHSIIGLNVASILRGLLRKRPCIAYNSDVYIQLDGEENCLCPDASVSCDRRVTTRQELSAIPVWLLRFSHLERKYATGDSKLICIKICHQFKKFFSLIPRL